MSTQPCAADAGHTAVWSPPESPARPSRVPVPPRTRAVLLPLQDRVEKTQHHVIVGNSRHHAWRVASRHQCRPSALDTQASGPWLPWHTAIAPLQGLCIGCLDHAHAQETAAANSRRDVDLLLATRVRCSSATRSRGNCCGALTVVPTSDGRPKASQARYQHMASRPEDRKYKGTFSPRRCHRPPPPAAARARSEGGSPSTQRPHAPAARSQAGRGKARPGHAAQDGVR